MPSGPLCTICAPIGGLAGILRENGILTPMSAALGGRGATLRRVLAAIVCLLVAAGAYVGATGLLGSLYDFRSPMSTVPEQAAAPLGAAAPAQSRRVVAVLVDGLRVDTAADIATMPFLAELRARGASATMGVRTPSYSVPGWTVLMTGAWTELHGGLAMNPPDVSAAPAWVEDSIFRAAHDAGLRTGVSGTDWFAPLIPTADLTTSFFVHEETDAADQASTDAAIRMIEGDQVDFLLLHLNEVDHAGHYSGGGDSAGWRSAASKADARLRAVASSLDLTRDTLVVFSDHGHLDQGGHGGPEDIVVRSPLVLAGSGVRAGATIRNASAATRDPMTIDAAQTDLAPTLAALLGTRVLRAAQGQALTGLLTMDSAATDSLHQAQATQQNDLLRRYAAAIGVSPGAPGTAVTPIDPANPTAAYQAALSALRADRLGSERLARLWPATIVLLVAMLSVALWWRRNPRRVRWALAGGAAYLVVFHGYYWGLARRTYSLSSVLSATEIIVATATATTLGLLAAWFVALLGERPGRRGSAGTIAGVGYAVLLTLAVPVLVGVVLGGWTVTWMLPDALPMFLQFFSQLQGLVLALLTLVIGGIALLVGHGRRVSV